MAKIIDFIEEEVAVPKGQDVFRKRILIEGDPFVGFEGQPLPESVALYEEKIYQRIRLASAGGLFREDYYICFSDAKKVMPLIEGIINREQEACHKTIYELSHRIGQMEDSVPFKVYNFYRKWRDKHGKK